jgi:probable phosphoglycerate mutase
VTRLIIWRHGQTSWNREQRIQGQQDTSLDDTGRAQAAAVAPLLAAGRIDLLVSSDLRRARETAETLAALTGLPVEFDPRLRERMYGDWEGLTHQQIGERWPVEFQHWKDGIPVPECGLENSGDVAKRASAAMLDVVDRIGDGAAVVVSHGGSARQGIGAVLGWPIQVVRAIGPLANCHWSELRGATIRGWRLHAHNVGPVGVPAAGTPDDPAPRSLGTAPADAASERL